MGKNIYYNRLKIIWESMGYKDANEFAKSLHWKRAESILRLDRDGAENTKPGLDILSKIVKAHPNFDFLFFLTGVKKKHDEPEILTAQDAQVDMYSCPDCRPRVKKIKNQAKRIDDLEYTIEVQKELIEKLRGGNEQCKKENLSETGS